MYQPCVPNGGGSDICPQKEQKKGRLAVILQQLGGLIVVEPRGVEPLSESTLTGTSPGADDYLHSLTPTRTVTLRGLVESLCMARATLTALTDATKMTPLPARGPSGADGCG